MFDIEKALVEICGDEDVLKEGVDLVDEGFLDSFSIIELFNMFEDNDINISPTDIKRDDLRSLPRLKEIINNYYDKK